jgi:2-polyprenyl-3-methyl-5-hydroxy-6-metoxy-1,4-benzoquinol methylase
MLALKMTTPGDRKLENLTEQNRIAWETRSKLLGTSLKSVLFKRLPDVVNEHLHNWHRNLILNIIENKHKLRILDVGCGYGRLSVPIIEKFPGVDIAGIDISENFVRLYKATTHHSAFVETVENIPAALGTFDYILCVTVLMYLEGENLKKATCNLLCHLKPEGKLIVIEPHESGVPFQTGFGVLLFARNHLHRDTFNTKGRSFRMNEIENLFDNAGGRVLSEYRLPITSLFILPLTLIGRLLPRGLALGICKIVSRLDALLGKLKLPSIYVAYLITKNRSSSRDQN